MSDRDTRRIVTAFWQAMNANDFVGAGRYLAPDAEIRWPQSGELIRGPTNFAALNAAYPVAGRWRITLERLICEGNEAAADVRVTDDTTSARALSFATIRDGRIARLVEWWPDPFPAPAWRAGWVETEVHA